MWGILQKCGYRLSSPWNTVIQRCLCSIDSSSVEFGFSEKFHNLLRLGASESNPSDDSVPPSSRDATAAIRNTMEAATQAQGDRPLASETLMTNLCSFYGSLGKEDREAAMFVLSVDFGVKHEAVTRSASELIRLQEQGRADKALFKCERDLKRHLSPFYSDVFTEIAKLEGGMKFLLDFRADLLNTLKSLREKGQSSQSLSEMDRELQDLLRQWFMPQLLELHQMTWQSPCDLLEKVSSYEAVHPLRHWKDLKHRLGPSRRCYMFMHKTLPREPLIIMHTALTSQPANSMKSLLDRTQSGAGDCVTTANFYSISNTQPGLAGVSLGTSLIKKVVEELRREFPKELSTFVTLSPIPGFRDWLSTRLKSTEDEDSSMGLCNSDVAPLRQLYPDKASTRDLLREALSERGVLSPAIWNVKETEVSQALATPLTKLCARYLIVSKRRGYALDPVANFHLRNGACVWRLNWMADTRLHRSYGLMVNYKYDLPLISSNSLDYIGSKKINCSQDIQSYLV